MKKKKVFDKEKGQRRIKNTVHNNNATDRVSPKSSTKSITDADILNPGMITGVQYIINSSLLFARSNIEAGSKIGDLPNHVYFSAIERIAHCAPASLTKSIFPNNQFSEEELKKFEKRVRSFGASGKRTKEQATAAAKFIGVYVNSLKKNSIQAWTDGSKLGKGSSGPTGAGVMITRTGDLAPSHLLKYHLGNSTNQGGEIWAIGGALTSIRDDLNFVGSEIHIFSDSDFSIKCLTGIYNSKIHHQTIKQVIEIMDTFPRNTIFFQHVAGHAGIPGNDKADELANEGAKHSEQSLVTYDLANIAKTYGFNHQLIREELYGDIT